MSDIAASSAPVPSAIGYAQALNATAATSGGANDKTHMPSEAARLPPCFKNSTSFLKYS